ncbi:unnamed protein product [Symbiodinium sp. CCMP2592]|nr:unnamed protein product [Symbiodinium sp. CCMP2592]
MTGSCDPLQLEASRLKRRSCLVWRAGLHVLSVCNDGAAFAGHVLWWLCLGLERLLQAGLSQHGSSMFWCASSSQTPALDRNGSDYCIPTAIPSPLPRFNCSRKGCRALQA